MINYQLVAAGARLGQPLARIEPGQPVHDATALFANIAEALRLPAVPQNGRRKSIEHAGKWSVTETGQESSAMYPVTADGRYFIVKGQLWRCSNPALSEEERQHLVHDLMEARRAVKEAKASNNAGLLRSVRARVDAAKVALGERGPVWWSDGSPDYNRHWVVKTPYADWYSSLRDTP